MICKYELRFAGIMNDLEDLMFDVIDEIIDQDGDLENDGNALQGLLTTVTDTYMVHDIDLDIISE